MSKSVLLVSYYFAPQNVIGAVRPTKLAKYLTRMGYEVTVLCGKSVGALRDPLLERDLAELKDVQIVRERSLFRWWKERGMQPEAPKALTDRPVLPEKAMAEDAMRAAAARAKAVKAAVTASEAASVPSAAQQKQNRLLNALYLWLFHRGDMAFARACTRKLLKMDQHFDVVFSCYGPLSVHTVARRAKRFRMADRWIADFRDEVSVPFGWQKGWLARYMRRVRKNADVITGVGREMLSLMHLETFGQVLPNGYDLEDAEMNPAARLEDDALTIAYCGQLYAGHSDVTPVFEAVRALTDSGECDPEHVRFHYAGQQGAAFTTQAARYGLAASVVDHGMLPRGESLALQRASDALLMATWNTPERRGVITGKLLEYMMADRPVLCCVSGKVPRSEARALIDATGIGIAYEAASAATDAPKLRDYIRGLYQARFSGELSPYAPNRDAVAAYHYPRIAASLADLIDNV